MTERIKKKIDTKELLARLRKRHEGRAWAFLENVRSDAELEEQKIRYADALAVGLWPSNEFAIHGFEIKCSRSDFLCELRDPEKSKDIKRFCDYWWLVAANDEVIRCGGVPDDWGLILPSGNRLRVKIKAPKLKREPISPGFLASLIGNVRWRKTIAWGSGNE